MGLTKSDFERLDTRLKNITEQKVEEIEIIADYPPTLDNLEDNNKAYSITAAILFIDIRKSTHLTETSQAKSMVRIYRSFMRMAVECVRKNGGVTRQFSGDRIMGVFLDTVDADSKAATCKAADKAIESARCLQTVVDYSLNRYLKANVNGKVIECGIGIDFGKVLVTKVGMYGVEQDETKENETDCVWVGNTTNHASKYCDLASGGEIFISESVYNNLSDSYKDVWTQSAKYKGATVFKGYTTSNYYLDYAEELGDPIRCDTEKSVETDSFEQLADGIREIERLQNELIKRERELAVLEDNLKKENKKLKDDCRLALQTRDSANNAKEIAERKLLTLQSDYYAFICGIINFAHCKTPFVREVTEDFWVKIIDKCFEIGQKLDYTEKQIKGKNDCGLIAIYSYYKRYEESYDVIIAMAEQNTVWVNLEESTLNWAKENCCLYTLQNAIESRLVNHTVASEYRTGFENALYKVKKLRGV